MNATAKYSTVSSNMTVTKLKRRPQFNLGMGYITEIKISMNPKL